MGQSGERSPVLDALAASVCPDPDVEFVVAFGSQIAGESTRLSDLDIAIKFDDALSSRERFDKRCFFSGDIQREEAPFVDLSDIEELPIEVAHDAINGQFVCGNEQAFERFMEDIEARFTEQRDTLRRNRRDVIDRIAEDGLRG